MNSVVLRTNAIPVYGFLSVMASRLVQGETLLGRKILECGAGGRIPPLVLFHQHGLEGWGIDKSAEQLELAREFCREQSIELHLREGDIRSIEFEGDTFDYVYEHYSMCHLSKKDTRQAVSEMRRVRRRMACASSVSFQWTRGPKRGWGKRNFQGSSGRTPKRANRNCTARLTTTKRTNSCRIGK